MADAKADAPIDPSKLNGKALSEYALRNGYDYAVYPNSDPKKQTLLGVELNLYMQQKGIKGQNERIDVVTKGDIQKFLKHIGGLVGKKDADQNLIENRPLQVNGGLLFNKTTLWMLFEIPEGKIDERLGLRTLAPASAGVAAPAAPAPSTPAAPASAPALSREAAGIVNTIKDLWNKTHECFDPKAEPYNEQRCADQRARNSGERTP